MSPVSRYRLLLGAYPRAYRDARGEEMLAVLLATEKRRGPWSVVPEAASLVMHGLALRVRRPFAGRTVPAPVGIAGVGLLLLLAVLGAHQLAAMGVRGLRLDGYPESWQVWRIWVDPRWPIQLAWLAAGVALLLRWQRTTVVVAWTAALLHAWWALVEVATGLALPWFGDVGPAWDAPFGAGQAGWLLLSSLAAATLIGGPAWLARALDLVPTRSLGRVPLAGLLGSSVAFVAAPALFGLTAGDVGLSQSARGPALALLAGGMALLAALWRTPEGRQATLLLALAALVPLASRWNAPSTLPIALIGVAVFAAGYAFGTRRRDSAQRPWQRTSE